MNDLKKMLRAVIIGQSVLKQELLGAINKNKEEIGKNREEIRGVEKRLTNRLDRIGLNLAELSDDAPTREEHDALEKRVGKVESTVSSL